MSAKCILVSSVRVASVWWFSYSTCMRKLAFVVLALTACSGSQTTPPPNAGAQSADGSSKVAASSAGAVTVSAYGKVLRDLEGDLRVEMALIEPKNADGLNDVLLRIVGRAAEEDGIDGKVVRYGAEVGGTGVNYKIGDRVRLLSRPVNYGQLMNWEAYVANKEFKLLPDEAASKSLDTQTLVRDYKAP
jgi:hypothetical protein